MKYLIIILFLFSKAFALNHYYIDNSGSDAANGTSSLTPWQTVLKANSFLFSSGDTVSFKCGGVWNEKMIPNTSLYFNSYSTGNKPIITGFQSVTGFSQSGNIWTKTIADNVNGLNTVIINGVFAHKARFPNTGYLTFTSYSGDSSITGTLTGTPDYTGKEIVVRTAHWVLDVTKVQSQSTGTLHLSPKLTYTPSFDGNGYFFQNDASFVDTLNEYSYDSTSGTLKVFSTTTPTVQISNIDTLVLLSQKNNVTFNGISFTGANKSAIAIDTSRHTTITNCSINYSGSIGISGAKSAYTTIQYDTIQNSLSGAIYLRRFDPYTPMQDTCNFANISNNYIKNTGVMAGMGLSSNCRYFGIYVVGTTPIIKNNIIDSTGYVALFFNGAADVEYNYVTNYNFVKDDGGGIYTVIGNYIPTTFNDGFIISNNIVQNGLLSSAGTAGVDGYSISAGIYLDDHTQNGTLENNTLSNNYYTNIKFNPANTITMRNNLLIDSLGYNLRVVGNNTVFFGCIFKSNIYYQQNSTKDVINYDNYNITQTSDSNYYLRPTAPTLLIHYSNSRIYTFPHLFQDSTGYDLNGGITPTGITAALPVLYTNPTLTSSIIVLAGTYTDARGVLYGYAGANNITMASFTTLLLWKTTAERYSRKIVSNYSKMIKL